ncbi:Hsp20/alpha crystallin family protein [candidate division KSB1 bacterium]|nr:Hsp20/alpha crystallin family protein [candidate division KSB1 bacterium]
MDQHNPLKTTENMLSELFFTSRIMSRNGWCPNTDIFETRTEFVIRLELPGVKKEDISLILSNHSLIIRGKREDVGPRGRVYYHQMEISYGLFERTILLPEGLDEKSFKSKFSAGFLEITIPKSETS